jgi:hypothetical protein
VTVRDAFFSVCLVFRKPSQYMSDALSARSQFGATRIRPQRVRSSSFGGIWRRLRLCFRRCRLCWRIWVRSGGLGRGKGILCRFQKCGGRPLTLTYGETSLCLALQTDSLLGTFKLLFGKALVEVSTVILGSFGSVQT